MELPKRVRFFSGKLVTAEDLAAEQEYHLARQRLRNRRHPGPGVVTGLRVSIETAGFGVTPGLAIDPHGREIIVPGSELVPYGSSLQRAWLIIRYKETLTDPVPSPTWGEVEYTRIEEGYELALVPVKSSGGAGSVVLAELERTAQGWRVIAPAGHSWVVAAAFGLGLLLSRATR